MDKDIKVGNFYHVLVKVLHIDPINGEIATETANEFGTSLNMEPTYFARCEKEAFFPITSENSVKNSEPAPKHDPCRLYREGDKVRYIKRNGRFCPGSHAYERHLSLLGTVIRDEKPNYSVFVNFEHCSDDYRIDPAYLELVKPVEEQERYVVEPSDIAWFVVDTKHQAGTLNAVMFINAIHPNAKAAAEAECARLNADCRKEQQK